MKCQSLLSVREKNRKYHQFVICLISPENVTVKGDCKIRSPKINTVDSRYLEIQGTL